ncbi:hypothetical protein WK92_03740 [Burkholderia ubonensis]|nr:hypothetical protein WK82_07000 [Burkholderia ubonensis]KVW26959.1 hypothetical protein WK92_03740 [Burkholderia ubonensis]
MHGPETGKPGPLVAVVVVVEPEVVPDEVDVDVDVVELEPPQPPFHFRALADWVPPSSPPQAASMAGRIRERANGAIFRIG